MESRRRVVLRPPESTPPEVHGGIEPWTTSVSMGFDPSGICPKDGFRFRRTLQIMSIAGVYTATPTCLPFVPLRVGLHLHETFGISWKYWIAVKLQHGSDLHSKLQKWWNRTGIEPSDLLRIAGGSNQSESNPLHYFGIQNKYRIDR